MIEDHRRRLLLEKYVKTHSDPEPETLAKLARKANLRLVSPRMMSGHIQGRLLKMFVRMQRPHKVLELGTYSAYATACIAEALPQDASITTIEIFDELKPFISEAIKTLEISKKVHSLIGNALEIIPKLPIEEYDMIYIDANKRHYVEYIELLEERLPVGAVVIADNTLWDGKVVDPNEQDEQTVAIRKFNDRMAKSSRFEKVILPIRDGLTIMYKIE
ncbi:O-methyltransferase [Porphyromonas sp.]|uniref:O-methyltransferase n=1 Tax=Porphyromonas sp. TaxID=1924944 RepID=UPI0026DD66E2|nr:O-methyltransferase [Porphyromonas sp.]MDO4770215.1 O-methyltransferase [Porphyromonas sp.]